MGTRGHPLDVLAPDRVRGLDIQTHVRVEGNDRVAVARLDQRTQRRADRLDHAAVGAEVDRRDLGRQRRQMLGQQLAVGTAVAVEAVARHAGGVHADQAQRRRCIAAHQRLGRDALLLDAGEDAVAEKVARDRAQEDRAAAHALHAGGDIQWRATHDRIQVQSVGGRAVLEHIQQGFATDDDGQARAHGSCPVLVLLRRRRNGLRAVWAIIVSFQARQDTRESTKSS